MFLSCHCGIQTWEHAFNCLKNIKVPRTSRDTWTSGCSSLEVKDERSVSSVMSILFPSWWLLMKLWRTYITMIFKKFCKCFIYLHISFHMHTHTHTCRSHPSTGSLPKCLQLLGLSRVVQGLRQAELGTQAIPLIWMAVTQATLLPPRVHINRSWSQEPTLGLNSGTLG